MTTTKQAELRLPSSTKTITKMLDCALLPDEYRLRALRHAEKSDELEAIEDSKKKAVADFNSKIKGKKAERDELREVVKTGMEKRPITCREVSNHGRGIVEYVREDTDEVVETRAMTSAEKQLSLPMTSPDEVASARLVTCVDCAIVNGHRADCPSGGDAVNRDTGEDDAEELGGVSDDFAAEPANDDPETDDEYAEARRIADEEPPPSEPKPAKRPAKRSARK